MKSFGRVAKEFRGKLLKKSEVRNGGRGKLPRSKKNKLTKK
jgi:hypothetical protein